MAIGLSTLSTTNNGGSNGGAVYFDLQVADSPITISALSSFTSVVSGYTPGFRIYTKLGTAQGAESNSSLWSLATLGGITPNGGVSPVALDEPIVLSSNTLYGFALVMPSTISHRYNTGTCLESYTVGGNCSFSDDNLTFIGGSATAPPFASTIFSPRIWSGTIFYDLGDAVLLFPSELAQIRFHLSAIGVDLPLSLLVILDDMVDVIRSQLAIVESAYALTALGAESLTQVSQQVVNQDIVVETVRNTSTTTTTYGDRTTTNYEYVPYNQRVSAYHREVEKLAIAVGLAYA